MPWSYRGDRKYFTSARRIDGRIAHVYLGAGEVAVQAANEIERRRTERLAIAEEANQHRQQHTEAAGPLEDLDHLTELLAKGTLLALGYHQHDRTWRKRRDHTNDK